MALARTAALKRQAELIPKKKKKIIPEVHIYDKTGDDEPRIWILSPGKVR